jgi:hypothetical protein
MPRSKLRVASMVIGPWVNCRNRQDAYNLGRKAGELYQQNLASQRTNRQRAVLVEALNAASQAAQALACIIDAMRGDL